MGHTDRVDAELKYSSFDFSISSPRSNTVLEIQSPFARGIDKSESPREPSQAVAGVEAASAHGTVECQGYFDFCRL
jgi:hypothetical protein